MIVWYIAIKFNPDDSLIDNKNAVNQPIYDYLTYKKTKKKPSNTEVKIHGIIDEKMVQKIADNQESPSPTEYWRS